MRSKIRQQVFVGKDVTNSLAIIPPQDNDGTAITGIAVDRLGAASGYFLFNVAAATGSPDAAVTSIKLQHSATTTSGDFVDFLTLETALDIDAAGKCKDYMVKLDGAKRYVRLVVDTTYTGGTTPKNVVCASVVFGDFDIEPKIAQSVLG